MSAAIEIEGLNHYYGKGNLRKQILSDVNVSIPEGRIIITTGPSGSGKTTLLTLVGALRSVQEGSLKVLDTEMRGASQRNLEAQRKKIGYIFQHHNLLAAISALQNVELGLRSTGKYSRAEIRRRARNMLESVGLGERMNHKPEQLSGGQRQRVAIARALAAEPPMLLADEPTASLDKTSGREVVDIMESLAREQGTTILLVTHDSRILDIADQIVHLEDGVLSTFTESVLRNNEHMMDMLRRSREKTDVRELVDDLAIDDFRQLVDSMVVDTERFVHATTLANDQVLRQMLENSLFAFTRKLTRLVGADRASLFLVDHDSQTMTLRVSDELPVTDGIRVPLDRGLAASAATSGQPVLVDDAYEDDRFNPEVDREFGYRTRSVLAVPVIDKETNAVYAVVQLLNRLDGKPFDDSDVACITEFADPLGTMLAGLHLKALK